MATKPEMRPDTKGESPRDLAARRAAAIREGMGGSVDEGSDKYYISPDVVPDGWTYEWKTLTVLGAENPAYQVALARRGWEPVPIERHPDMMPVGHTGKNITRDGLILMERPAEITDEVRKMERKDARNQVRSKEEQLSEAPQGQFGRDNRGRMGEEGSPLVKVSKSYEAIPVPEE